MATRQQIEDAERVLQAVLDSVPHEDYETSALNLLVNAALAGAEVKCHPPYYKRWRAISPDPEWVKPIFRAKERAE